MADASSAHLDLEALAELEEGLTEPGAAAAARAHVEACADCGALLSRLRTTRALVTALPPEPMPAAVAARVDAALAGERNPASGTIVPLGRRRRAWNNPAVAGGAAAAAVVLLVAGLVAGTLLRGHHKNTTSSTSSGASAGLNNAAPAVQTKVWSTGTNYTAATLATLVPRLVTGTPPTVFGGNAGSVAGSAGAPAAGPAGSPAPRSPTVPSPASSVPSYTQEQLRTSPAAVQACGEILAGGVVTTPVAVDFASFDGKPAVVFALPAIGHRDSLDVWVVRSNCSPANLDLYFQRIPRPRTAG